MRRLLLALAGLTAAAACSWVPAAVAALDVNAHDSSSGFAVIAARRPQSAYAIYKTFYNPRLASRDGAPVARYSSVNGHQIPLSIVLRWGHRDPGGWGYRHIKERRGYNHTLESVLEDTVFAPEHIKTGHHKSGESYVQYSRTFFADKRLDGSVCTFYVIENPDELKDRIEKGIITAYDNCYTFFG